MRKVMEFDPKKIGKMFQTMMDFTSTHHILQLEIIGETHTFPGRTDRIVMKAPPRKKIRRVYPRRRRSDVLHRRNPHA